MTGDMAERLIIGILWLTLVGVEIWRNNRKNSITGKIILIRQKEKKWYVLQRAGVGIVFAGLVLLLTKATVLPLLLMMFFCYWGPFDMGCGIIRYGKPAYLGDESFVDKLQKKIWPASHMDLLLFLKLFLMVLGITWWMFDGYTPLNELF